MKQPFQPGDIKSFIHVVGQADTARFESGEVHSVYSTFALAREAEWSGRLFVLDMKEQDEEGIGTGITVKHLSPALVGEEILFIAILAEVNRNEVVTDYRATVGDRLVAEGRQWQKILKKEKLTKLFSQIATPPKREKGSDQDVI
jgi:predicted thioesterase